MKKISPPPKLHFSATPRAVFGFVKANLRLVGLAAAIIIIGGAYLGWRVLYFDRPAKAWQDMLDKSVQTKSVQLVSTLTNGTEIKNQTVSYQLVPNKLVTSEIDITQGRYGEKMEGIGTPDADYARFTALNIGNVDTSKLLNVWAKLDHPGQATTGSEHQLLSDAVLRLGSDYGIILADVPAGQRGKIEPELRDKVLSVNVNAAKRETFNKLSVYAYDVKIKPSAYYTYLKDMSAATGIKMGDYTFDAGADTPKPVRLYVSRSNHRLVGLTYPQASGYQETYDQFDQPVTATIPTQTISFTELTNRLNAK